MSEIQEVRNSCGSPPKRIFVYKAGGVGSRTLAEISPSGTIAFTKTPPEGLLLTWEELF